MHSSKTPNAAVAATLDSAAGHAPGSVLPPPSRTEHRHPAWQKQQQQQQQKRRQRPYSSRSPVVDASRLTQRRELTTKYSASFLERKNKYLICFSPAKSQNQGDFLLETLLDCRPAHAAIRYIRGAAAAAKGPSCQHPLSAEAE